MQVHGIVFMKNNDLNNLKNNSEEKKFSYFELFILWLESQRNMSKATVDAYKKDLSDFNIFIENKLEKKLENIQEITKKDIQFYLVELHEKNYNKTSVSRKLSSLRSFFNYAMRKKLILKSPIASIKNPKQATYHPNVPSMEQVVHILEKNKDKKLLNSSVEKNKKNIALFARDIALIELLYGSGLRISEALSLDKKDFSEKKKSLLIMGKGGKQRLVPLTEKSVLALTHWLKLYSSLDNIQEEQALFIGMQGKDLTDVRLCV